MTRSEEPPGSPEGVVRVAAVSAIPPAASTATVAAGALVLAGPTSGITSAGLAVPRPPWPGAGTKAFPVRAFSRGVAWECRERSVRRFVGLRRSRRFLFFRPAFEGGRLLWTP